MAHRPLDTEYWSMIIYLVAILVVLILALDPQVIHFEDDTYRLILRGCYLIASGPFKGIYCE